MSKLKGELAELKFYVESVSRGWVVSKPYGDSSKYDFIVDVNGRLFRVQVKSTSTSSKKSQNDYSLLIGSGNSSKVPYHKKDVDVVAVFLPPENLWYIIPITAFNGFVHIHLWPNTSNSTGQYEKYKSCWDTFLNT